MEAQGIRELGIWVRRGRECEQVDASDISTAADDDDDDVCQIMMINNQRLCSIKPVRTFMFFLE